jgi:hypothetical protein
LLQSTIYLLFVNYLSTDPKGLRAKMRWFSSDVSDEARRDISSHSPIELAKSEAVTQGSLGRSPISVNLRSLGLRVADLSRPVRRSLEVAFSIRTTAGQGGRDSVKVAQYEVLGNVVKDTPVP